VFALIIFSYACNAQPEMARIGTYNYQTDESSPLFYNGKILIMETMSSADPARVYNCGCYFAVRDLATHKVLVSLQETCNHAFGAAIVGKDDQGKDTIYIYGTRWTRFDNASPKSKPNLDKSVLPFWDGPCSTGDCTVDVFWSNDPELKVWHNMTAFQFPKGWKVYNVDVAPVDPDAIKRFNPTLPAHRWIMILEIDGLPDYYLVNNATTPVNGKWELINVTKSAQSTIFPAECPTIRYVPATGYFYVLTGGHWIYFMRSKDLRIWEPTKYDGSVIIKPSFDEDCTQIPKAWSDWTPSANAVTLLTKNCTKWDQNADDIDITEIKLADGSTATLLMWDASDQRAIGFSELAVYKGDMASFFAAWFV